MPVVDFKDILTTLPTLQKSQLEQIRQRALHCLGHVVKNTYVEPIEEEDWILHGIKNTLIKRGVEIPHFTFNKNTSYRNFLTISPKIRELLEEAVPGMTFVERRLLGEIAADALADYLKGELSLRLMVEHASLIPQAIDRAFPGYLASRMLGIIIKQRDQQ